MKAAKIIHVDREREDVLRREIAEATIRHRAALETEIAAQLKELSSMSSVRPMSVATEGGYTYFYRPGALPHEVN